MRSGGAGKPSLTFRPRGAFASRLVEGERPNIAKSVLLLSPSRGVGGGIERYISALQWAFTADEVDCHRIDLSRPGGRAHLALLAEGKMLLRNTMAPMRIIVGHRSLLTVGTLLARERAACGLSIVCHGAEIWRNGYGPRAWVEKALMRRPEVRVVAVSSFTAGALSANCQATILPPGFPREWFEMLARAAATAGRSSAGIQLLTAFRLTSWREKGLPELAAAIAALGRADVRLTVCGTGSAPMDLLRFVSNRSWCSLQQGLKDSELARCLATADLFVLATRTRIGKAACGEGFGMILLEAQVAGTPVIAPAHGGSADAYVESVTGAAPADETSESLAVLLQQMLDDPARLASMGGRAAEWARQTFAPERYPQLAVRRLL